MLQDRRIFQADDDRASRCCATTDEIGLLAPETVDSFTGYRYYSARQLEAAGKIQALKSMGFGLATIREILARYDDA